MSEVENAHAYYRQMGRGCLRETALGAGAERGRGRAEFSGLRARASGGRVECACVRCVFACGHSSRHQPLSQTRGSELFLFFVFGVSSFLSPLSRPSTRTPRSSRPVGAPDSQTQVRRAQRASRLSRFPQAPSPRPVRSAHSAFTLLEFDAAVQRSPHPLGAPLAAPVLHSGLPLGFPRLTWSLLSLALSATRTCRLSLGTATRPLTRSAVSKGNLGGRTSIRPWTECSSTLLTFFAFFSLLTISQ